MIRVFYNRSWYLGWNMRLYSSQVELKCPPCWREKWAEWQLWQLNWDEMANGLQYLGSGSIWAEPAVQGKFFILQGQVIIVQGQVIILHGQVLFSRVKLLLLRVKFLFSFQGVGCMDEGRVGSSGHWDGLKNHQNFVSTIIKNLPLFVRSKNIITIHKTNKISPP